MFSYLKKIDEKIYDRYLTVERNIKSASNSFYDSYLDLVEQFLKIVIEKNNFEIQQRATCGEILRKQNIADYFLQVIKLDGKIFNKLKD